MNRSVDPAKKNEHVLIELLKIETNKYCADCNQKGRIIKTFIEN